VVKSLSIKTAADKEIDVVPISLPMFPMRLASDMWTGADDRPKGLPSKAVQCLRLRETGWVLEDVQQLICVLTGELSVAAKKVALTSGDTILIEKGLQPKDVFSFSDDCSILSLHVPDWVPEAALAAQTEAPPASAPRKANFKWLYSGADTQSYFSEFNECFDETRGWGAKTRPVYSTIIVEMADGFFMDWHAEGANNIVLVLCGELELETAGGGGDIQRFGPGDICVAVDRTGQGHIDRAHGRTVLANVVIPSKSFHAPSA
jgi:quercetin dioxygenase-like cupin family protein